MEQQPPLNAEPDFYRELDPDEMRRQAPEVHKAMDASIAPQRVSPELMQLGINI